MKSYQILAVIGGVLGVIVAFSVFVTLGVLDVLSESFGGESIDDEGLNTQIGAAIALYIVAIIIPFVLKQTKIIGGILLGLGAVTLILAGYFGIIGFGLLIAAGIAALRAKPKPVREKPDAPNSQEN